MSEAVQLDLLAEPQRVGRSRKRDPLTSRDAGRSVQIAPSLAYTIGLVAEIGPCTAEQLEQAAQDRGAKWRPSRLRSALAEAAQRGVVVQVLPDGVTSSGRAARRWRVA